MLGLARSDPVVAMSFSGNTTPFPGLARARLLPSAAQVYSASGTGASALVLAAAGCLPPEFHWLTALGSVGDPVAFLGTRKGMLPKVSSLADSTSRRSHSVCGQGLKRPDPLGLYPL